MNADLPFPPESRRGGWTLQGIWGCLLSPSLLLPSFLSVVSDLLVYAILLPPVSTTPPSIAEKQAEQRGQGQAETPCPLAAAHRCSPSPAPGKHSSSPCLSICLLWPFHINRITPVGFCVWFLSFSRMCSGFVHIVAGVSALFFFMTE